MNCKEITTRINEIKSKKNDFDVAFTNGSISSAWLLKSELTCMIKELQQEIWPFTEEEFSMEKITAIYEQYKSFFERNNIVADGEIVEDLIPDELKEMRMEFLMPTKEQFLDFIRSRSEKLQEMLKLGLVEPVLVPIATDFGRDSVTDDEYSSYSGLLGVVAKGIRELGRDCKLKGSNNVPLPRNPRWDNGSADPKRPIDVNTVYYNMLYSFKESDGSFSTGLSQRELIQKHIDSHSPFPGFAIYFKEKGNLLTRTRKPEDALYDLTSDRQYREYQKSLHDLGLTGSTAHTELILLLSSLQIDGKVTRDLKDQNDAAGFIGGNTFYDTTQYLGRCYWYSDSGQFFFDIDAPSFSFESVAGIAMGELI